MTSYLDVLAWNCWVANDQENVLHALAGDERLKAGDPRRKGWLELHRPHVAALSEASTHAAPIRAAARREGYVVIQQKPGPRRDRSDDSGDVAVLVRKDVEIAVSHLARMTERWRVFSHNVVHEPHEYERLKLRVPAGRLGERDKLWRFSASHFPTLGPDGPNREAWEESARRSRAWLYRGLRTPSIDVGDINGHKAQVADWYGPRFDVWGEKIDIAVTRNVTSASYQVLGLGGSDAHRARVYRFAA